MSKLLFILFMFFHLNNLMARESSADLTAIAKENKVLKEWAQYLDSQQILTYATEKDSEEFAEFIQLSGANINALNKGGNTALMQASSRGCFAAVVTLVQAGAELNLSNKIGNTAIMIAAHRGYFNIVKVLLEQGAELHQINMFSRTALDMAAVRFHEDIVHLLVDAGARKFQLDSSLGDELIDASYKGRLEEVKCLLLAGACIEFIRNGHTALYWSVKSKRSRVVELLLENGANPGKKTRLFGYLDLPRLKSSSLRKVFKEYEKNKIKNY